MGLGEIIKTYKVEFSDGGFILWEAFNKSQSMTEALWHYESEDPNVYAVAATVEGKG